MEIGRRHKHEISRRRALSRMEETRVMIELLSCRPSSVGPSSSMYGHRHASCLPRSRNLPLTLASTQPATPNPASLVKNEVAKIPTYLRDQPATTFAMKCLTTCFWRRSEDKTLAIAVPCLKRRLCSSANFFCSSSLISWCSSSAIATSCQWSSEQNIRVELGVNGAQFLRKRLRGLSKSTVEGCLGSGRG